MSAGSAPARSGRPEAVADREERRGLPGTWTWVPRLRTASGPRTEAVSAVAVTGPPIPRCRVGSEIWASAPASGPSGRLVNPNVLTWPSVTLIPIVRKLLSHWTGALRGWSSGPFTIRAAAVTPVTAGATHWPPSQTGVEKL